MFEFEGQTVIVTGASRGIGAAVTERFLQSGATVIGVYQSNETAARALKERVGGAGRLHLYRFDVSDYQAVENFFSKAEAKFDSIDVLVNNAGIRRDSALAMMSLENWQRVLDVNLNGTYSMCKFAVMSMMKKRSGRIINITSLSGKIGIEGQSNYAASKAAQMALTKSLSKEVAKRGITVNCVSPGFIETGLIADLDEKIAYDIVKAILENVNDIVAVHADGKLFTAVNTQYWIDQLVEQFPFHPGAKRYLKEKGVKFRD